MFSGLYNSIHAVAQCKRSFKGNVMNYPMQHPELDQMICEHHDVPGQDLECYFEASTGNLWFVYVNGGEIHELLRDSVIQTLESAYAKACKEEADNDALDFALARYEMKKELA